MSDFHGELPGEGHARSAEDGRLGSTNAGQPEGDEAGRTAGASEGHKDLARPSPLDGTISEIRSWHRRRCFAMEQRKRSDLALGSFLRTVMGWSLALPKEDRERISKQAAALIAMGEKEMKGKANDVDEPAYDEWRDVIAASLLSRKPYADIEAEALKAMGRLAKSLPVWEWGEPIRGFGAASLAVIVGEAGDLSNYATHSKLWKRMGLAVMDGVRQGGLSKTAAKADWIAHGYSRQRRSRMWNIGDAMVKTGEHYRQVYLDRKEYERERAEASGLTVAPSAKIPEKRKAEFMSDGHVHRRAQRYMEKRLLKHLWKAWRRAIAAVPERASVALPAADKHRDAA